MAGARLLVVAALLCSRAAAAQPEAAQVHEADVLYLPTPHAVVESMLQLAGVSPADVVYDLGSGDGRIPIAAARTFGARGVGIELDGRLIERARRNARKAGVERRVEFRQEDLFGADLREATVVTLFLFPQINRRLGPKLRTELRPGTRIVSHRFGIGDWKPERVVESGGHPILLWTVP
jgi:SAM-dependent methyltransferase